MSKTKSATTIKRGRPVVEGSKRQAVLAMRDEKRAQGIEIKRGRPKGTGAKKEENMGVKINKLKAAKTVTPKIKVKAEPVNVTDDIKAMFTEEETTTK